MKRWLCLLLCVMLLALAGCAEEPIKASCELPPKSEITDQNLKDVFAEHGMKVGTCVSSFVIGRGNMEQIILDQFNSVTMENAMKPDAILNQNKSQAQGSLVVEYGSDARKVLEWAKEQGMAMRGHTLIWYSQTPEWIFHEGFDERKDYVGREEMLLRMETLIRRNFEELERLGALELFYAYDVVNEGWMEDGSMRQNLWSDIIGEDYLWYAFYYADQYAPESIDLYYNDYNEQYKAETLCEFVKTLVDENGRSLIDGIGLQAHFFTADDLVQYFEAVDQLAETGLKLELTEVDVGLGAYQNPLVATLDNLKEQGRFYFDLINGLFERADAGRLRMDAITFWGFSNLISWRKEYAPQLYDDDFLPKYAYYGAMQFQEYAGFH